MDSMKRTKQSRGQESQSRGPVHLTQADLVEVVGSDVYLQHPRGSNNAGSDSGSGSGG